MKTITQSLLALCCCVTAHAAQQLVVPNNLVNTEGNTSNSDLFINGIARMVQVYSASEFSSFGAPILRIDGVSFRAESGTGPVGGVWNINVFLGTTPRSPDALSLVFDENLGADSIVARAGPWGFAAVNDSVNPRPFDVDIAFTTPFFYEPASGNLALSIIALGTRELLLDAQLASGDGVGRVYGPNAVGGAFDTLGLVTRFDITPVPEPSVTTITAVCVVLALVLSRRNSIRNYFSTRR
jgi:hypothetical protein